MSQAHRIKSFYSFEINFIKIRKFLAKMWSFLCFYPLKLSMIFQIPIFCFYHACSLSLSLSLSLLSLSHTYTNIWLRALSLPTCLSKDVIQNKSTLLLEVKPRYSVDVCVY